MAFRCLYRGLMASVVFFDGTNASDVAVMLRGRVRAQRFANGSLEIRGTAVPSDRWVVLYKNGSLSVLTNDVFHSYSVVEL